MKAVVSGVHGAAIRQQTLDRQQKPRFGGESETAVRDEADITSVRDRGELHAHLNGSIPLATIREILDDEATELPAGFRMDRDLARRAPSPSLATYLTPWQALRLFPKRRENLDRLALATFESFADNRVRFVELRSSVLYLATLLKRSPQDALQSLIESTKDAAQRHGIRRGLVLTVTRGDNGVAQLSALLQAYQDLGQPSDVVGLDLAGDEEMDYPPELPTLFREAKDRFGLGLTVHAGETGRAGNVREAVELFNADRIGHGTAAGKDPRIMDLLASKDICVEVCPISNRLTGALHLDDVHPLVEFQGRGTPFVVCSDNPGIHDRGLAEDQEEAIAEGLTARDIHRQYELAKRYSFMEGLE